MEHAREEALSKDQAKLDGEEIFRKWENSSCSHLGRTFSLSFFPIGLTNVQLSRPTSLEPRHDSRVTSIVLRGTLLVISSCHYGRVPTTGSWVGKNVNCGPDNGLGSRSSWTSIRPRKGCIKYRYRSIDDKSRAGFEQLLFSFSFPSRLDGVRSSRLLFISVYFSHALQPFLSRLINKTMDDCRPIYKSPRYFLHLPDSK